MRFAVGCLLLVPIAAGAAPAADLADYYGFLPVEIVRLSARSGSLLSGDFNRDGRTDVVLVDNTNHRLDVLLQRNGRVAPSTPIGAREVNRIEDHWRFEHRKLPVDQDVASLAVGDFNHDGRTDLAYFGLPDQLVIRFQPAEGEWTAKQQIRVPDAQTSQWTVAGGDLNADGRDDLVILGKSETIVFYQPEKGPFGAPERLMNTSDKLGMAQVADLDGDGRLDLCYVADEGSNRVLGLRLQDAQGRLGPEFLFDLERPRAVSIRDVDGQPGSEVLTIDARTGRLKILRVARRALAADELPDRLMRYGFGKQGSGRERDLAIADLDGDGLLDVAVTDPDASRVLLFRQSKDRGLDLGAPFPSFAGAALLEAGVLTPGRTAELVVHSAAEKSIGVSRWQDGRLTFPETLPIETDPVGLELLDVDADGTPEIVLLARTKKGRESEYALQVYRRGANGWEPHADFGDKGSVSVLLKGTPERLLQADLIGDARPELLAFQGSKPPAVFSLTSKSTFEELPTAGSLGAGSIAAGSAFPCRLGDVRGLLVAQDNFARLLHLGAQQRWQVADQFNAGETGAKIEGAAVLDMDGRGDPEIVLIDTGVKKVRVLRRGTAGYAPWKEIDLGEFTFKSTRVADLNSDGRPDLAIFGADQLGVLLSAGTTPVLDELAVFESQLEKVFPTDVVAGDLNGDGRIDLAMTDARSHLVEILHYRAPAQLQHALYFKIFEEKSFAKEDAPATEPREALIADVTGDGLPDVVVLAHDRLLVYPQDDGKSPAAKN